MSKLAIRTPFTYRYSVFGKTEDAVNDATEQLKKDKKDLGCYVSSDNHVEQIGATLYATNVRSNDVIYK